LLSNVEVDTGGQRGSLLSPARLNLTLTLDRSGQSAYTGSMIWYRPGVVGLTAALLVGCQQPHKPFEPTACLVEVADPDAADRLYDAAKDTLRRYRFRLDRVDRRAWVITTHPQSSQHFFEFWRRDVHSAYDWFDATMNPVRRRVEVSMLPVGDLGNVQLSLTVVKERLSMPDRQFNDAGAAYQFFGYSLPATTGQAVISRADEQWISQGRDAAVEQYLLDEILARAGMTKLADPVAQPSEQTPN